MTTTPATRLARTALGRTLLLVLAGAALLGIALATWMTVAATGQPAATTPVTSTATTTGTIGRSEPDGFFRDGRQEQPALPLPPRPHGHTPLMG